jgi:hypothetical protein
VTGSIWLFTAKSFTSQSRRKGGTLGAECISAPKGAPRAKRFDVRASISREIVRAAERTMLRAAAMNAERDYRFDGYTVAYDRDEIQFPVWILMILGAALLYVSLAKASFILLLVSGLIGCFAFYSFPLLETGKTRLAANPDGLFIEGLGRVAWRAVAAIDVAEVMVRGSVYTEAEISLSEPLTTALLDDDRKMAPHRRFMRKPFYLKSGPKIRVPLDIFDRAPDDIISSLTRIWVYNRGRAITGLKKRVRGGPA